MTSTPFPNQPPDYANRNLFLDDLALGEAVVREGAAAAQPALAAFGALLGTAEVLWLGDTANRCPPELHTHDARGERVDGVSFHPAWDALMRIGKEAGEHCDPWIDTVPGAQVARAAKVLLHAQVENGTQCPITMTFAGIPVLRRHVVDVPQLEAVWLPRLLSRQHDPRSLPIAQKTGALVGMGMTERQGGSDVRANVTRAQRDGNDDYRLTGHKWFFSVPQSDAHLLLAQDEAGLSCFLVPRFDPAGQRNAVRINRLKDKLGNRSNASAEVELDAAHGFQLGAPGRGVATILEMVRYTRLDCILGSTGIMRAALARALHHAHHRVVFGHLLIDQPLMRNVLADLALEVEAATALALRLARAFEALPNTTDHALARLLTPAAKFWICKRGPAFAAEAMEVLGGNGYVETSFMPRLYRELPVNSIWEGSGNVMCLDLLRTAEREPASVDAVLTELALVRGDNRHFDAALTAFEARVTARHFAPDQARRMAQLLTVLFQASLLLRHAPAELARAFCNSRLGMECFGGATFGTLAADAPTAAIVARALPPS